MTNYPFILIGTVLINNIVQDSAILFEETLNKSSVRGEPDATTSHSTWLPAEELLAGHPKDGNQVAGYVEL